MDDLVQFLRERYDDEAQIAREATAGPWRDAPTSRHHQDGAGPSEGVFAAPRDVGVTYVARTGEAGNRQAMVNAEHIARHDPARVLVDIEAKRQLLAEALDDYTEDGSGMWWKGEATVRLLALPYADHPDYRPEWKP